MHKFFEIIEAEKKYQSEIKYKLAVQLSTMIFVVFLLLGLSHIEETIENLIIFTITCLAGLTSLIYVKITKDYTTVFYILCTAGLVLPHIGLMNLHNTTHYADMMWIIAALMLAFLGTNIRYAIAALIFAVITVTMFVQLKVNVNIETVEPRTLFQKIALNLELIGGISVCAYFIYLFNDFYRKSDLQLVKTNEDLKLKNEQISRQDEEKTILVKEVHHRVKNNLQIIISLLRMQSYELQNDESKKHFEEAINRIMAMSLVHQKLYQESSLAKIELDNYFTELVGELKSMYSKTAITSTTKIDVTTIGLKSIVPLGLLLNELVSNSLEHAFKDRDLGDIIIEMKEQDDYYHLIYQDNGVWEQEKEHTGFGLELIDMLTKQLEGSKSLEIKENGSIYTFKLKNLDI